MSDSGGSPDCDYHDTYALEGIDQNDLEDEVHNTASHSRANDEALSSLLLLLKSTSNKDDDGDNMPEPEVPPSSAPLLYNGMTMHPDQHHAPLPPPQIYLHDDTNYAKSITMDDLRRYFHMPINDVAKQLGTCTTAFKKICRKNNISRWPYRQIRSLTKNIQTLEEAVLSNTLSTDLQNAYVAQMIEHRNAINELVHNPNTIITIHKKKRPADISGEQNSHEQRKQRPVREETTYGLDTGWVADCSNCGKMGKYRPPSDGRPFQHSSGVGKYCGYFRVNPRQRQPSLPPAPPPVSYGYINGSPQQQEARV